MKKLGVPWSRRCFFFLKEKVESQRKLLVLGVDWFSDLIGNTGRNSHSKTLNMFTASFHVFEKAAKVYATVYHGCRVSFEKSITARRASCWHWMCSDDKVYSLKQTLGLLLTVTRYIPLMLYPRRGNRGISDILSRRRRFNKITYEKYWRR
jgi:hypothetical protein